MDIHRCRFVDYTPHTITASAFSLPSSTLPLKPSSSNKLRLAVGRSNGDIEIWNPKFNWIHELTLPGSKGRSIEGLVWATAEGEPPRLFSIGGSTYITEWDLSTGRPKTNYDCNAGVIWSIDVNDKGDKLAVGCDDGSVVIVDISGGFGYLEHGMICQRQDLRVLSIKWFESKMLVGGCSDARIRIWSADEENKGRLLSNMRVDKSKAESTLVWSVMVLSKKRQIVSGDSTGSVKFWDLDNFSLLQTFKIHDADVLCLNKDVKEEKIFSAGVDRKIHQFELTISNKSKVSKWIHCFNRLLHSNDVRTMSIFESKNYNFLVSGGVERSIVIQSVSGFQDGKYKKLAINQQQSNIVVNSNLKLIIMWQDQTIKIWRVLESNSDSEFDTSFNTKNHVLIAKLTLSDEENITNVSINEDASLLAVSRINNVKFFKLSLIPKSTKLKINKIRDDQFDSIMEGGKKVFFYDNDKALILSASDELYKFKIDTEEDKIELIDEIDTLIDESTKSFTSLGHLNSIKDITIDKDSSRIALSRFNGTIEILPLNSNIQPYILTRLSSSPQLMKFTERQTLIVITEDTQVLEYNASKEKQDLSLLTQWSKTNSEFLPNQFTSLDEKPQGLFLQEDKLWLYGSSWLSFFDLSIDIPTTMSNNQHKNKKRGRDGLSIDTYDETKEEDEDLEEDQMDLIEGNQRLTKKLQTGKDGKKPFWITTKYRPILKVDIFGNNEIAVIERDSFTLPTAPTFDVHKVKV